MSSLKNMFKLIRSRKIENEITMVIFPRIVRDDFEKLKSKWLFFQKL